MNPDAEAGKTPTKVKRIRNLPMRPRSPLRLSSLFAIAVAFVLAAGLALIAAGFVVTAVEEGSEIGVRQALDRAGHNWTEVEANGLQVILTGTAKDEAIRFNALSVTGKVVDAARIIDAIDIAPTADLAAPHFSAEILRNDSGISIIGLIPTGTSRKDLVARLRRIDEDGNLADLLETAQYPAPRGWEDALSFAVLALTRLPRSKVSVDAGQVSITAISDSADAKHALEAELTRAAPPGLRLALNISAPRPVITPFTLRYLINDKGRRFDACSADTDATRVRILAAAHAAGLTGSATCTVGMGVPSPYWAKASELSIQALASLGGGTVTLSDADITLVAAMGTNSALFDRVVGELDTALPQVFALHAVLPVPAEEGTDIGPSEFTATLSPEGLVQLRGRLGDKNLRHMADSYAKARFGTDAVYTATRVVDGLPADWPVRVLSGLEALALLTNGVLTVTPEHLELRGATMRQEASAEAASLLADRLGGAGTFSLDIAYQAPPEPVDPTPEPDQCEAELIAVQETAKIAFEPGSATIATGALKTMDTIADILNRCGDIRLEIQGHTDSQGRESMNKQLSQARAQSVLNELRARRVLTSTFVAVGYGESQPIADNGSGAGREANRRIAFHLIRLQGVVEVETTLESIAQDIGATLSTPKTEAAPVTDPATDATANPETAPDPASTDDAPTPAAQPETPPGSTDAAPENPPPQEPDAANAEEN
ncbi:MAG: OOP family OmpA-OmpF porin [Paracoccaceae bacterium]